MSRSRLDHELVRRNLFSTRSGARNAIRQGFVLVDGEAARKPARQVSRDTEISVAEEAVRYVGRGAFKLVAALDQFQIAISGKSAIDVGSSTGGFTEVLLESGATEVVALDVGRDQLHPRLRTDRRVRVREGTNVRDVDVEQLGGPFGIVTADLSFISLTVVAADLERLGSQACDWVVLVKPQFEVGPKGLSKDGIVLSAERRGHAIEDVGRAFADVGLVVRGVMRSPISGGSGNVEALMWLRRDGAPILSSDAFKVLADE